MHFWANLVLIHPKSPPTGNFYHNSVCTCLRDTIICYLALQLYFWSNLAPQNPYLWGIFGFLTIVDPYLGLNEVKWHIFHLMCGHRYWSDSMSSYLAHLMRKTKQKKKHFCANLALKIAFFVCFCPPPYAKNTWNDLTEPCWQSCQSSWSR